MKKEQVVEIKVDASKIVEIKDVVAIPKVSWGKWFSGGLTHTKEQITIQNACDFAKKTVLGLGQFGISSCGQMGTAFIMQRMYKELMYPNTLRWYIHTYVPYKSTIKSMRDVIEQLRDTSLETEQIAYNKQRLQELCYCLARQGECICGYMTYKSKQLDEEVQPMAEQAERYFVGYYNNWLKRMNAQLAQEIVSCDELVKLIESHEKELNRRLSHFAILESETDEEKCMIDERVDLSIASQVARLF